jgi:hypothetical protein
MSLKGLFARLARGGGLLALLTLATSGLFKIAAFAREAFIASHFGLSSFTDAYFAFQQFPLILSSFMFGAFSLAFTPAYAAENREGRQVAWLPGLVFYGCVLGLLLTVATVVFTPWLLSTFTSSPTASGASTLIILGCTFLPVIWLGIWSGTTIAHGHNVRAMFVGGLPYLTMTVLLIGLYAVGRLNALSLPLSFLAGFSVVGIYTLVRVLATGCPRTDFRVMVETWRMPAFRRFLGHLTASSIENLGYSANQLLLVFFLAKAGTGAVSANTCAMRVGMLGFSLLGQPLAQLMQSKLCSAPHNALAGVFKRWLLAIGGLILAFAVVLYLGREPIVGLVYLHGKFSLVELKRVIEIVPAWVAYFVVSSMNAMVARYLFATAQGGVYVRRQLGGYLAANAIRFAFWGRLSAPMLIWCSVIAEGCALLLSLRSCFERTETGLLKPEMAGAQEA